MGGGLKVRSLGLGLAAALMAMPAAADTLADALVKAYQLSPLIESARAGVRITDEGVPQALAARRPQVSASVSAGGVVRDSQEYRLQDSYDARVDGSLLIYDSNQTRNSVEAAKAFVAAARENLRSSEQSILLDAVTAYSDVLRDQALLRVARSNVERLEEQVQASNDRFAVGEVTRTDVSRSEAALAAAQADLANAIGALELSRQFYTQVVGMPPVDLQPVPPAPQLPGSLDDAQALALERSPIIGNARFNEIAATFQLRQAKGARGPSVSVGASIAVERNEDMFADDQTDTAVSANVTGSVPLYQGGALSSGVRQAEQALAQARFDLQNAGRVVQEATANAWSAREVAQAAVMANREAVEAATIAFEGTREEATLGARTTLDVLDAEQDLRDAEFDLVSSQRDAYVAVYNVLEAIGLLTVEYLGLGIESYNPDVNYQAVRRGPYSSVQGNILDKISDRYAPAD